MQYLCSTPEVAILIWPVCAGVIDCVLDKKGLVRKATLKGSVVHHAVHLQGQGISSSPSRVLYSATSSGNVYLLLTTVMHQKTRFIDRFWRIWAFQTFAYIGTLYKQLFTWDKRHTIRFLRLYFQLFWATPNDRNASQWSSERDGKELYLQVFMSVGVERNRQKRSLVAVSVRFDILRSWKDAYIQTPDYSLQVKYKGEVTTENVYTCYMTQSFGSVHKASRWFFLGFPVRFLVIPKVTHVLSTVYSSHSLSLVYVGCLRLV